MNIFPSQFMLLISMLTANILYSNDTLAGLDKKTIFELMDILNVKPLSNELSDIVIATQKAWLRKGERWETDDLHEEKKEILLPLFKKFGLIDSWMPKEKNYDGILFLGSGNLSVENKINFLITLFKEGLTIKPITLLTGQRYLTFNEIKKLISIGADKNTMITEKDMMEFIINNELHLANLSNIEITVIDTQGKRDAEGIYSRPTTIDTVIEWLKINPKPGHYLVLSFQPHCLYQLTILKTALPSTITIEVIGDEAKNTRVAVILDAITRTLYAYEKGLSK